MYGRFTEKRKSKEFSQEIAAELGHSYVGTEHLLYGLIKEGRYTACIAKSGNDRR